VGIIIETKKKENLLLMKNDYDEMNPMKQQQQQPEIK